MSAAIRPMCTADKPCVLDMMRTFYASAAVLSNGSEEIFHADIDACTSDNPYLEGFIIENADGICGYAMIAKSFSTEFGKPCIWIEDLYLKEHCRGAGLGSQMLQFIADTHPDCLLRLEVEAENDQAVAVYKKNGFSVLPYMEMKK